MPEEEMLVQIGAVVGTETVVPSRHFYPCERRLTRLRQRLDFLADVGFDAAEVSPGGLSLIRNGALDRQEASAFRDIMSSYSLAYTLHVPLKASLASPSLLEISEKIFRSCIDFCAIVGARIVTMHSGYLSPLDKISESKALKLLADSLRRCARHAADSGVSVGVENGNMGKTHICRRTDKLVRVVEDTGMSNVGITLDLSHLYVSATYYRFDFMSAIKKALPHMIHMHLSDNFGKFDPVTITGHDLVFGYGAMHLPIGWGSIPWRDIVSMIKDDYNGIYMFEFSGYSEHFGHAIEAFRGFFV